MSFLQILIGSIKGMFPGFLIFCFSHDPFHHCRAEVASGYGSPLARLRHEHLDQSFHSFPFPAARHRRRSVEWQVAPLAPVEADLLQLPQSALFPSSGPAWKSWR
jgi:hypothetical protein